MNLGMTVDRAPFRCSRSRISIEFRTRSGVVQALDGVGFAIKRGETLALVGRERLGQVGDRLCGDGILDTRRG